LKKKKKNESVNEGFTKYHIRLTKTPGWYGVWDKNGKQKFEGDKRFVMKHLKKLKTRMGNFQLKSLIDVATKRKGKDITFDVVESVDEERDYKAEYKKYGSSTKAKKYRAELNQYNRKKGTYGNGDGKDASHKGGKIVGFENQSVNRGRAEKSRLKKESVNERKKRDANNLTNEFSKSFKKFTVAVNGLAKSMYNITGNRTDQKIVMKAFKKHIIPFVQLVDSWNRGQQKNPHLSESVNEAVEPQGNMAKIAKVVKDKQATKLSGVMIDMQSANLLMKLWDAVSDKDKEKMNKLNAKMLTTVIKRLWSRVNLKLPV